MYLKNLKTDLFQWDTNQILVLDEYPSGTFVHIGNNADRAYTLMSDSNCEVEVPNILLQECKPIVVYVQVESEDGAKYVDKRAAYPVRRRGKPDDYVYTPTEVLNYETLLLSIQTKQGALTAGAGITIDDDNVITADSATPSVLSVNGQTGTVALDAADVGAVPAMLSGDGAPTASTAGENGQLYINTLTECIYVCEGETSGVYPWRILAASSDADVTVDGSVSGQRGLFEEYKVKRGVVNGIPSYTALNADDVGALPATKNGDVYELTGVITWDGETLATEEYVLGVCELFGNKVTTISSASTDTQYPSAKCVYDAIATAITGAIEGGY